MALLFQRFLEKKNVVAGPLKKDRFCGFPKSQGPKGTWPDITLLNLRANSSRRSFRCMVRQQRNTEPAQKYGPYGRFLHEELPVIEINIGIRMEKDRV